MKITSVTTATVRIPFDAGATANQAGSILTAGGTQDTTLVRIDTDEGVTGWGEGFGFSIGASTRRAIDTVIAPLCIGRDPRQIDAIIMGLNRTLQNGGRNGPVTFGIAAIDIALWDIAGKMAKQPLHKLLGGRAADHIAAYASLPHYGRPDLTRRATEAAVKDGFREIKLHEIESACVREARAAAPGLPLMVDANCPYAVDEAIRFAREIAPYELRWLEEPSWPPEDAEATAAVRAGSKVPIAAGENCGNLVDFRRLFASRAVDFVQPSVTKMGVGGVRAVASLAREHNVAMVPHSPYYGPGLLATIHLVAALGQPAVLEYYYVKLGANLYGDAAVPVGGRLAVPQGPGLGFDPDPAVIARFGDGGERAGLVTSHHLHGA